MTFARRSIDLRFQLGTGDFGEGGADVVDVVGLRVSANIARVGGATYSTANLRVYGLSRSVMNKLSTLGQLYPDIRRNTVTVTAGDDESGKAVVFSGQISEAYADFSNAPDNIFTVSAWTTLVDGLRPLPPTSYPGTADAAVVVSGLAEQMGYAFENNGVTAKLSNPYYPGTGRQQLEAVAREANFDAFVDDTTAPPTVVMLPRGAVRGGSVPLISQNTGLVGYPTYVQNAVGFTCLFNPNIRFRGNIELETDLAPAKGSWNVYEINHELESESAQGPWFTHARGILFGNEAPLGR